MLGNLTVRDKGHGRRGKILMHYSHEDYKIDFVTGQVNYMIIPINCGKNQLRWMQQIMKKDPIYRSARNLCSV